MTPPFGPLAERAVASQDEPEAWMAARAGKIGASDAARYSRLASVDLYVAAKYREWSGDVYAARGHYWEPPALAAYGFDRNAWLYRSADNPGYVATPDGIRKAEKGIELAEVKATMKATFHPDGTLKVPPAHYRQMLWAQYVIGPEARLTHYIVVPLDKHGVPTQMLPHRVLVPRDDAKIEQLLAIARPVLEHLTRSEAFRKDVLS